MSLYDEQLVYELHEHSLNGVMRGLYYCVGQSVYRCRKVMVGVSCCGAIE